MLLSNFIKFSLVDRKHTKTMTPKPKYSVWVAQGMYPNPSNNGMEMLLVEQIQIMMSLYASKWHTYSQLIIVCACK